MQNSKKILLAKFVTVLAAIPVVIYANSSGAFPNSTGRVTGAPGEQTCAQSGCHTGTAVNGGGGNVAITYSGGTSYVPGQRGTFTVTITDAAARRYGFQASARLVSNLQSGQAGTLIASAGAIAVCSDDATVGNCRPEAAVQFITHNPASQANTFAFDWTPPAAGAGDVRVYVAGNAANGNGLNSGDRIYTANITLTPAAAGGGSRPAISDAGVAGSWSAVREVAANAWTTMAGTNLSATTRTWDGSPEFAQGKLPLSVDGVSVTVNNVPAPVFFISPTQINFLSPTDTAIGPVAVVVRNANGESAPVNVTKSALLPSLLTQAQTDGRILVIGRLNSDANVVLGLPAGAGQRPFRPGDVVQFYATGLGPTTPAIATDTIVATPAALVNTPIIRINDVVVPIVGSALVGSGLYQVNGTVPQLANGTYPITIEVGGVRSPASGIVAIVQQ